MDRRGRLGLDSRPLGAAALPAAAVPGTDGPVFLWLPLAPPGDGDAGLTLRERFSAGRATYTAAPGEAWQRDVRRAAPRGREPAGTGAAAAAARRKLAAVARRALPRGGDGGGGCEELQVLLRLQISRPRLHNVLTTFKVSLAGLLLNTKTFAANELLNLAVDRVSAMLLRTTRELQLTLVVAALQLDNQALETHHPVVLAPSGNASLVAGAQAHRPLHHCCPVDFRIRVET
ncbi:hypothetical protein MNEG_10403 [Monoraphidium neglectum]|uniref:Uncharacterized protein n=1 Tax=Monoraphidium neglectum TaxID=145388 RepID=A0A0D2MSS5_9CHLO|nr:hypothetical protein MNEG_10403 [Monoraphidium neglectum]KIY97560.1 hypothetical protein MNEG_10403 [Monoraphidium neglectum]|eukprot:XP_013896580.1 hypothetical protein MNEG_10403 [Monoraphidium neglectum]